MFSFVQIKGSFLFFFQVIFCSLPTRHLNGLDFCTVFLFWTFFGRPLKTPQGFRIFLEPFKVDEDVRERPLQRSTPTAWTWTQLPLTLSREHVGIIERSVGKLAVAECRCVGIMPTSTPSTLYCSSSSGRWMAYQTTGRQTADDGRLHHGLGTNHRREHLEC